MAAGPSQNTKASAVAIAPPVRKVIVAEDVQRREMRAEIGQEDQHGCLNGDGRGAACTGRLAEPGLQSGNEFRDERVLEPFTMDHIAGSDRIADDLVKAEA